MDKNTNLFSHKDSNLLSDKDCEICFDEIKKEVILSCSHIFCNDCLSQWIVKKNTCPKCRVTIDYIIIDKKKLSINRFKQMCDKKEIECYKEYKVPELVGVLVIFLMFYVSFNDDITIFNSTNI
tara:strand:+ start:4163 stop:4534 length:372 start_codon:yes stop_codon:yes gene_type:complete